VSHASPGPEGSTPAITPQPSGRLTLKEVQSAFAPLADRYGPILYLHQASELSGYSPATLKKKLSEGAFRNSVARGKPLRFWRDRFVLELMNKPASRTGARGRKEGDGNEAR
jgi:hypothetical protein